MPNNNETQNNNESNINYDDLLDNVFDNLNFNDIQTESNTVTTEAGYKLKTDDKEELDLKIDGEQTNHKEYFRYALTENLILQIKELREIEINHFTKLIESYNLKKHKFQHTTPLHIIHKISYDLLNITLEQPTKGAQLLKQVHNTLDGNESVSINIDESTQEESIITDSNNQLIINKSLLTSAQVTHIKGYVEFIQKTDMPSPQDLMNDLSALCNNLPFGLSGIMKSFIPSGINIYQDNSFTTEPATTHNNSLNIQEDNSNNHSPLVEIRSAQSENSQWNRLSQITKLIAYAVLGLIIPTMVYMAFRYYFNTQTENAINSESNNENISFINHSISWVERLFSNQSQDIANSK